MGQWQDNPAWHYTLAFYQKAAEAAARHFCNHKNPLTALKAETSLRVRIVNQSQADAYTLLLFLGGEAVATRELPIAGVSTAELQNEEFWRLSQRLFKSRPLQ